MTVAGFAPASTSAPHPRTAPLGPDLLELYVALGGSQTNPAVRPGPWDLAFTDGIVLELDEELHFNRYRALTLQPPWAAERLPWRDSYLLLCERFEAACRSAGSWGKRWTNASCEKHFAPGAPGELDGPGAPRWKQRASTTLSKTGSPPTPTIFVSSAYRSTTTSAIARSVTP